MSNDVSIPSAMQQDQARRALRNAEQCLVAHANVVAAPPAPVFLRLKRSMLMLVDQVQHNQHALLQVRREEASTAGFSSHSARVSVLCLAIGSRLGLARAALHELGLSGLLHDIGKQRLASEVVDKRGPLTEEEWEQMRRHPVEGLVLLQGAPHDPRSAWRPMLAAYEHHMKCDQSGYPRVRRLRRVSLYSRIVAVADVFDAVTSPRSYRARPWPQALVLRNMLEQPRWGLDRAIVKVLIQLVGLYPVGSFLQLQDGRLVTVIHSHAQALHAPRVRVLTDAGGNVLHDGPELELAAEAVAIRRSVAATALPPDVTAALGMLEALPLRVD
jgi:HD-GYP domain-containing protein (c-di-GMP phosphodiesterase class II)